ncbi:MAG: YidC/Oxa1 family membrane protein insertase [Patescibacteria group bacterium]|nr:YidC/Oxa1 family membrane protein insertase [Patescibacteria group bacterium]
MLTQIWTVLLYQPILNALILLYQLLFSNLGLAIIALTALIRLILIPLTNPQLKSAQKMQELAPELDKLKKKYKDDKQKLMQAQMELYKTHGINPTSGCLPQILQFVILISLYQAFNLVVRSGAEVVDKINQSLYPFVQLPAGSALNLKFLYLNLSQPDLIHIPNFVAIPGLFVILATVFQFLSSKLMMPVVKEEAKEAKGTKTETDDMAVAMQKQMLYLFPLMTLVFGYTMPSGVILYWFIFSLFAFIQQVIINNQNKKGKVLSCEQRSN